MNPEDEYAEEIYFHLLELEQKLHVAPSNYVTNNRKMRYDMLEAINNYGVDLKYGPATVLLAMYMFDRIHGTWDLPDKRPIPFVLLWIAGKYEEISPLKAEELMDFAGFKFNLVQSEARILKMLNYQIGSPFAIQFSKYPNETINFILSSMLLLKYADMLPSELAKLEDKRYISSVDPSKIAPQSGFKSSHPAKFKVAPPLMSEPGQSSSKFDRFRVRVERTTPKNNFYTVDELKKILQKLQLSTTGKKADLVARLLSN